MTSKLLIILLLITYTAAKGNEINCESESYHTCELRCPEPPTQPQGLSRVQISTDICAIQECSSSTDSGLKGVSDQFCRSCPGKTVNSVPAKYVNFYLTGYVASSALCGRSRIPNTWTDTDFLACFGSIVPYAQSNKVGQTSKKEQPLVIDIAKGKYIVCESEFYYSCEAKCPKPPKGLIGSRCQQIYAQYKNTQVLLIQDQKEFQINFVVLALEKLQIQPLQSMLILSQLVVQLLLLLVEAQDLLILEQMIIVKLAMVLLNLLLNLTNLLVLQNLTKFLLLEIFPYLAQYSYWHLIQLFDRFSISQLMSKRNQSYYCHYYYYFNVILTYIQFICPTSQSTLLLNEISFYKQIFFILKIFQTNINFLLNQYQQNISKKQVIFSFIVFLKNKQILLMQTT